jgi:hypothetical protein
MEFYLAIKDNDTMWFEGAVGGYHVKGGETGSKRQGPHVFFYTWKTDQKIKNIYTKNMILYKLR